MPMQFSHTACTQQRAIPIFPSITCASILLPSIGAGIKRNARTLLHSIMRFVSEGYAFLPVGFEAAHEKIKLICLPIEKVFTYNFRKQTALLSFDSFSKISIERPCIPFMDLASDLALNPVFEIKPNKPVSFYLKQVYLFCV